VSALQVSDDGDLEWSTLVALLKAVVDRRDRTALNDLVAKHLVCPLEDGSRVTIAEYIIARCTGRDGIPLPRSVDHDRVYDLLLDRFFLLPEEVHS